MDQKELITNIIQSVLSKLDSINNSSMAFVGFDGYIDKIQHPVKKQLKDEKVFFPTLSEFGEKIRAASNRSAQVELQTQELKIGGNGPIMAHALATLGIRTHCVGTLGSPEVNPLFQDIHYNCTLHTIGPHAETNALEFTDGKLILSELSAFEELTWAKVKEQLTHPTIGDLLKQADLIAMVDWCNLPHATQIWRGILDEYRQDVAGKMIFFDLADPSKKSEEEVLEVLQLISAFSGIGNVIFGLNENEARQIFAILGRDDDNEELPEIAAAIFEYMSIRSLVIHPTNGCYFIEKETQFWLPGRVESNPKVSTGGGDNFNAGLFFGLLNGLETTASVLLAMVASGAYVKNGNSPDREALKTYLKIWLKELTLIKA